MAGQFLPYLAACTVSSDGACACGDGGVYNGSD